MISGLAIHEAGHCVAAVVTGIGAVDRVTLDPPATHFTAPDAWAHGGRGAPNSENPQTDHLPDRARWRMAAVRLLAGVCAEARFAGEPFKVVLRRNSMDARMIRAFMDGLASDPDDRAVLRRDLLDETRTLVNRHWSEIIAVGRALAISKMLLGHEVERIIRRAQVSA